MRLGNSSKQNKHGILKRVLSGTLAFSMILSMLPTQVWAVDEDNAGVAGYAVCEHHRRHTEECGYSEGVPGAECTHVHDEDCGYTRPARGAPCEHMHDDNCGYVAAVEETPCDMACTDLDDDGVVDHADDCSWAEAVEGVDCAHTHDEICGYTEPAEGTPCAHEHDDECGYVQATEAHGCDFVCRICDYTVENWSWNDPYGVLVSGSELGYEDVSRVLFLDRIDRDSLGRALPDEIFVTLVNGDTVSLPVTWNLDSPVEYIAEDEEASADTDDIAEPDVDTETDMQADTTADDIITDTDRENLSDGLIYRAYLPLDYRLGEGVPALTVLVLLIDGTNAIATYDGLTEIVLAPSEIGGELHFIIRHWHTMDDTSGSFLQGDNLEESGDRYFTVVEGYIVPTTEDTRRSGEGYEDNFHFYLVSQSDDTAVGSYTYPKGERIEIRNRGDVVTNGAYVFDLDHETGIITLSTNELADENEEVAEKFAAYSVSAGHTAVDTTVGDDNITIKYDKNIHLVKAHAFYIKNTSKTKKSTNDEKLFGVTGIFGGDHYAEKDTATVYVYATDNGDNKRGDIVKDGDGKPVLADGTLPGGLTDDDVDVVKVYNSDKGMHTDKTATPIVEELGKDSAGEPIIGSREFEIEMEAWHSEGLAPQIGFILDASGSMAFASDKPLPINVYTEGVADQLSDKIAKYDSDFKLTVEVPDKDNLVGYYEFIQNSGSGSDSGKRNWYLNSVKHLPTNDYSQLTDIGYFAKFVEQPSGDDIDFSGGKVLIDYADAGVTKWGDVNAKFNEGNSGSEFYKRGISLAAEAQKSGFLLESASDLSGDSYTLSFTLSQNSAKTSDEDIEILYIGPATGKRGESTYFHVIRRGDDIRVSYVSGETDTELFTLATGFVNQSQHIITFVFEDGKVTAYLDSAKKGTHNVKNLSHEAIVFAPFADENTTEDYLWLDSIYLYKSALNVSEVNTLFAISGSSLGDTVSIDAFLTPGELELLMDPYKTDNSPWSWSGYSYYVYNPATNNMAYNPLGYYNNEANGFKPATENRRNGEGWYYVSGANWNDFIGAGQGKTAKALNGVAKGNYLDTIRQEETYLDSIDSNGGVSPVKYSDSTGTDYTVNITATGPNKFYIDADGYLRCFFATADSGRNMTSYVYKLEDSEYIRTEAMQRALGLFATKLNEQAPTARVSAVRFSGIAARTSDGGANLGKLLMLDWTDDPTKTISMLSLNQDDDEFYKYSLTGGTDVASGLQAYNQFLKDEDNPYNASDKPPKYLIIFTDGADDSLTGASGDKGAAAIDLANNLKNADYTIYTVLLDGGSMDEGTYNNAAEFLTKLAGSKGVTNAKDYFFSVKKVQDNEDGKYDGINGSDADILTKVFVDEILEDITKSLKGYTVQNYIDPRFDLVDKNGAVWHLNANGKVQIGSGGFTLTGTEGRKIEISEESTEEAQEPTLYYDSAKDLYYLVWEDQEIPGCVVGSTTLSVWNAKFRIRAKDDFIGGNAVLVDGTEAKQNYLYQKDDKQNRSSGTDRAYMSDGSRESKGFPRLSVNVTPPEEDAAIEQTIFMGENLDENLIARMIIDAAKEESEDSDASFYWDYIGRFVNYFNNLYKTREGKAVIDKLHKMNRLAEPMDEDAKDSLEEGEMKIISNRIYGLITSGDLTINRLSGLLLGAGSDIEGGNDSGAHNPESPKYLYIPYIYLPDDINDQTNSTGKGDHLTDVLGYLLFRIDKQDGIYPEDGVTKDTDTKKSELTVRFMARTPNQRRDWNNYMAIMEKEPVKDSSGQIQYDEKGKVIYDVTYGRDTAYKPAVGAVADNDIVINGEFVTNIVSGEVQLQLVIPEGLKGDKDLLGKEITYTADLMREYGSVNKKVGTLEINIDSFSADNLVTTAEFKPLESYMGYDREESGEHALPLGTYTIANGQGTITAGSTTITRFRFKEVEVVPMTGAAGDEGTIDPERNISRAGKIATMISQVQNDDGDGEGPGTEEGGAGGRQTSGNLYDQDGLFTKAEGHDGNVSGDFVGSIDEGNNSVTLGDHSADTESKRYTDFRFGLFRLEIERVEDPVVVIEKTRRVAGRNAKSENGYLEVYKGETVTYTITVANTDGSDATNITVTDTINSELVGSVRNISRSGKLDEATNTITWLIPSLEVGESVNLTFDIVVPEITGTSSKSWDNEASYNFTFLVEEPPFTDTSENVKIEAKVPSLKVEKKQRKKDGTPQTETLNVERGDIVTYTITVTNDTEGTAKDVDVTDTIPSGLELVPGSITGTGTGTDPEGTITGTESGGTITWHFDEFGPNSTATLSFDVKVLAKTVETPYKNIANAAGKDGGNNVVSGQSPEREMIQQVPDLTITKTRSGEKFLPGETVTYTIMVKNDGPVDAKEVTVTDTLPAGLGDYVITSSITGGSLNRGKTAITWENVTIPAGGSKTFTFNVTMPDNITQDTTWTNTASVSGDTVDDTDKTESSVTITEVLPKVTIEKTQSVGSGATVEKGSTITYTITVKNEGNGDAKNVVVKDSIPSGLELVPDTITAPGTEAGGVITWNIETLAAGRTKELKFTAKVSDTLKTDTRFNNTATVQVDGGETETSNSVTANFYMPDVSIEKSRSRDGNIVTYTLTVKNDGGVARNVTVTDTLPTPVPADSMALVYVANSAKVEGTPATNYEFTDNNPTFKWLIKELAPEAEVVITFEVEVPAVSKDTTWTNTATISDENEDVNDDDNSETITEYVPHITVEKKRTLPDNSEIADASTTGQVVAGDEVTYTIIVKNSGKAQATGVTVTDNVPAGLEIVENSINPNTNYTLVGNTITWTGITVNAAAADDEPSFVELSFKVTVPQMDENTQWTNTASTSGTNASATSNDVTIEEKVPSLQLTKTRKVNNGTESGGTQVVEPGDTVTYYLKVENTGDGVAKNVVIKDTIPSGLELEGTPSDGGTESGGVITWNVGDIAPSGSKTVYFTVTVPLLERDGFWTNTFTANGDNFDETLPSGEVRIEEKLPVINVDKLQQVNLGVQTKQLERVYEDDVITYTITVRNTGTADAKDVKITDVVPNGLIVEQAYVNNDGTLEADTNTITWIIASIPAGRSETVSFRAKVPSTEEDISFTNQANVVVNQAKATKYQITKWSNTVMREESLSKINIDKYQKIAGSSDDYTTQTLTVKPGDTVTYKLVVTNASDEPGTDLTVTDEIEEDLTVAQADVRNGGVLSGHTITWSNVSVQANGTTELYFDVHVPQVFEDTTWENEAKLTYTYGNGIKEVPSNIVEITENVPDVTIKKSQLVNGTEVAEDTQATVNKNDIITYKLTVTNSGTADAENVTITDRIPTGLSLVEDSINPNTATVVNGVITWGGLTVGAGESIELVFNVKVPFEEEGAEWTNTASGTVNTGTAYETDIETSNEVEAVEKVPIVTIEKSQAVGGDEDETDVGEGDIITYTITVKNSGEVKATDVEVTDEVPAGLEIVESSIDPNTNYTLEDNVITWTGIEVPAAADGTDGEVTLSFDVIVPAVRRDRNWINKASFSFDYLGEDLGDESNRVTANQKAVLPDVSIEKTQLINGEPAENTTNVKAGDEITYILSVKNTGERFIEDVFVTDRIPDGLELVEGSISPKEESLVDGLITWKIEKLENDGNPVTLEFTVTVPSVTNTTTWRNIANYSYTFAGEETRKGSNAVSATQVIPSAPPVPTVGGGSSKGVPDTSDESQVILWMIEFILSVLGMIILFFFRKRRQNQN